MNPLESTLLVQAAEAALQAWCTQRGLEYQTVRRELLHAWVYEAQLAAYEAQRAKDVPLEALLQRARDCFAKGNRAGYRQAWLQAKHGVALGDTGQLFGWVKHRTVKLVDFSIHFDSYGGFAWYEGPACSTRSPTKYPRRTARGLMCGC